MCGIAGIAGNPSPENRFSVERMVQAMRHRGPDAFGVETFASCCIGHARLSIVDLGTGQQPMFSADRRQAITFNGEIYGFRLIRQRLAASYNFVTSSDTEVLLALYQKMGKKMLDVLPGMFAFAIWDENSQSLFCARDRFGEKPFYYATLPDGRLVFASELKALLASGLIEPQIDEQSLGHFFKHLYVHPTRCIYKNVKVLPPGHLLRFEGGRCVVEPYWKLPEPVAAPISESEAIEEFTRLFEKSVRNQLVADVPIGVFLSGGLDSSTVTAVAASTVNNLRTFSFGFGENINELPVAESMARRYGTVHKVLQAGNHKISDLLLKTAEIFDEPLADSSTIPTYLISEAASRECKVVLGGDGGDELLGGYDWYKAVAVADRSCSGDLTKTLFCKVVGRLLRPFNQEKAARFSTIAHGMQLRHTLQTDRKILAALNVYFSDSELQTLGIKPEDIAESAVISADLPDSAMRADICNYLPGNILTKIDRAAMACSLELRAPFLDVELAEFCISLPSRLKLKNWTGKYLLRRAYENAWTEEVRKHRKQGFGAPVNVWLSLADVQELQQQIFANGSARIYDFIDRAQVSRILQKRDYQSWIVLVFALWLEKNTGKLCSRP